MKGIIGFTILACTLSLASSLRVRRGAEEDNIREAVFRYGVRHDCSQLEGRGVFFLSVGTEHDEDPSDGFMKRFVERKPVVRKASRAKTGSGGLIEDKETGELGVILSAKTIKWVDDTHVEVEVECYESSSIAASDTYLVEKRGDRWTVSKVVNHWVS